MRVSHWATRFFIYDLRCLKKGNEFILHNIPGTIFLLFLINETKKTTITANKFGRYYIGKLQVLSSFFEE